MVSKQNSLRRPFKVSYSYFEFLIVIVEGTNTNGVGGEEMVRGDEEEGNCNTNMCFDEKNDERRKQVPRESSEART